MGELSRTGVNAGTARLYCEIRPSRSGGTYLISISQMSASRTDRSIINERPFGVSR